MYDDRQHFVSQYDNANGVFAFDNEGFDGWQTWQKAFRPKLRALLGLDTISSSLSGYQPKAERFQVEDMGSHIREYWRIWTEPTVPLPFYLLRPKGKQGLLPLILTPHGHNRPHIYVGVAESESEAKSIQQGERDIAVQAVQQGYFAIEPTTRAFGETRTRQDQEENTVHSCRTQLMHDLLVGRTPIGDRVWDISTLIDWTLANLEVDANRIAITGNSGGGTISLFAAACDPRIDVAVPSSYFCTFRGSIGSINHCACNYVPGILRLGEMYDVAGLIAPRPFCAISGKDDPIFPITETKLAFNKLKEIYAAAGVPENCELYVGHEGHRYYQAGAWPFIHKHFQLF